MDDSPYLPYGATNGSFPLHCWFTADIGLPTKRVRTESLVGFWISDLENSDLFRVSNFAPLASGPWATESRLVQSALPLRLIAI